MFKDYLTNEVQKQHINLSTYAWDIIKSDMYMFSTNTSAPSLSGFLNKIFLGSVDTSPANLTNNVADKRNSYLQSLQAFNSSLTETFIESLINDYIVELKNKFLGFPKGIGKKFRLNNEAYNIISGIPENSLENMIYGKPGLYLKAIFETYARLPFIEREQLFFSPQLEIIKQAIQFGYSIEIQLLNKQEFHVIPYKIITDVSSNFTYIAGRSSLKNTSEYHFSSFRLSRIQKVKFNYTEKTLLSDDDKKELDTLISTKGIPFLLNNLITAKVKLSDKGVKKYYTQLHLRPQYTDKSKDNIFTFTATKEQLLFYFFKYGTDAEILEPEDLRNEFIKSYKNALDVYTL